jgi:hypothetical protein
MITIKLIREHYAIFYIACKANGHSDEVILNFLNKKLDKKNGQLENCKHLIIRTL